MKLSLTALFVDKKWNDELGVTLRAIPGFDCHLSFNLKSEAGQIIFLDSKLPDLDEILDSLDRRGRAVFLVVDQDPGKGKVVSDYIPEQIEKDLVDDILVYPFKRVDVYSRLKHYQRILMWDEVGQLNDSFSQIVERFREDLKLAERLQKSRIPERFSDVPGFRFGSRFFAGTRAGGDHFDIAESRNRQSVSMVLSDSSTYGLSSAVLSVLMRVAMKVSVHEATSSQETVRRVYDELQMTLGETDELSLFYGTIKREDLKLNFVHLGNNRAYLMRDQKLEPLQPRGNSIKHGEAFDLKGQGTIQLQNADRIYLLSDGYEEILGDESSLRKVLLEKTSGDSVDSLNELALSIKNVIGDQLPSQDCSALVVDVDPMSS